MRQDVTVRAEGRAIPARGVSEPTRPVPALGSPSAIRSSDGSASIWMTRVAASAPASSPGRGETEYGHPIASNSGANLREYAIAMAGTPVERAFRHACMRAPISTRDPAMIARASSRSRGATTSRSAPNSAARASTAGASLSRSWESSTCGSTATDREPASSVRTIVFTASWYTRASTCGFSCQSRPETLRITSRAGRSPPVAGWRRPGRSSRRRRAGPARPPHPH